MPTAIGPNGPVPLDAASYEFGDLATALGGAVAGADTGRFDRVNAAMAGAKKTGNRGGPPSNAVPPPTNLTNYTNASMAPFKNAIATMAENVVIFDTGCSTTAGQSTVGAKQPAFTDAKKQFIGAVAPRTAALLQAEGINASGANQYNGNHFGWGAGDTGANYQTGDDRITLGNQGATFNASTLGGGGILLSATTDNAVITLVEPATVADIWYRDVSAGRSFSWSVDGGADTEVVMVGDTTLKKLAVPLGARGLHTLKVSGTGKGGVVIVWINPYDASNGRKELQFVNNGVSGARSDQLIVDTDAVAGRLGILTRLAPKLVIVRDFHLNDMNQNVAMTTAMDNTDKYIKAAKNAGAAVLGFTPLFVSNVGTGANAAQEDWATATKNVYAANNVPFIDLRAELGSYAAADAMGFYSDQVHPTQTGYALIARRVADFVKYVRAQ